MSAARAASVAPFAAALLAGRVQDGRALGGGHVLFGEKVLTITPPGASRMPNGIETELSLNAGERVSIGAGSLRTPSTTVVAGPLWDPRPRPMIKLSLLPHGRIELAALAGRGPGLTPLGDDVLIGYLAGRALGGAHAVLTQRLAASYATGTTALSRTLLELAATGNLPETAHHLLVTGDIRPLLAFGATSGRGIAVGLALAGGTTTRPSDAVRLALPFDQPPWQFELVIASFEDARCS